MNLKTPDGPVAPYPDGPRPDDASSTCESCGQAFACGASLDGCWCAGVELDETARAELRARYKSCLCRACLESRGARVDG
ncbi:MAG: cysteine-rich CWC family protein [Pyrinomonadaceae bacterium]